jgi:hypothetical protein
VIGDDRCFAASDRLKEISTWAQAYPLVPGIVTRMEMALELRFQHVRQLLPHFLQEVRFHHSGEAPGHAIKEPTVNDAGKP